MCAVVCQLNRAIQRVRKFLCPGVAKLVDSGARNFRSKSPNMSSSVPSRRRSLQQMKSQVVEPVLEQDLTDLRRTKRFIHSSLRIAIMVAHDFFQHLVKL